MERVSVSAVLDVERASVDAELSPRTIIDHEGTYEVVEVTETGADTWEVLAVAPKEETEAIFEFERTEEGYAYELVDEGFFEELRTTITVNEAAESSESPPTELSMESRYTFGGFWARIFDPRAAGKRREELKRLRDGVAAALDATVASVGDEDRR